MSEEIYNISLKNYRKEIMIMFDTYDDLLTVAEVCVILRISASSSIATGRGEYANPT